MIEESLLKSNYLGKDGFIWWLGQVAPAESWDIPEKISIDYIKDKAAWAYRCKVRIIGYHTYNRNELADNDLPWAHVMLGPTDGNSQGGYGKTHKLVGGETVFGFFLDGDDAQQPVVVGTIYRNANVESFDINEIAFQPFGGHTQPGSRIQYGASKQTPTQNPKTNEPVEFSGEIIGGEMQPPIGLTIDPLSKGQDKFFPIDKALDTAYERLGREVVVSENGCDDNVIGKITRAIQNFISVINGLDSYIDIYIDPVLNTFVDITREIKRTAGIITGAVKFLINNMRNMIMKMVGCLFSKFVGLVIPIPQQPIVGEATKNILNIIFCIFENIIDLLLPFLEDMLKGLVGRAINAPLCAIEEFTATILNKVIDFIDDLLEPVLSGLDWLINGVSQVRSILSRANSIATQVFNLIGCDNLKCKTPSEWALNIGPKKSEYENWNRIVSKMNTIRGFNDNLDSAVSQLSIYGGNSSIFRDCAERVKIPKSQDDLPNTGNIYPTCLPPEIKIYGDGSGASAIAVVGDNGSILSVEMISEGFGYSKPPTINIIDKTNYGSGAKASAVLVDGRITQIYLTSSGSGYCETNLESIIIPPYYVVTADRYSFYEGEVCNFTINTQNVPDGTILSYSIGGEVDSNDLETSPTGNVTIFESKATVPVKIRQDSNRETIERLNFDLLNSQGDVVARTIVLVNDRLSPIIQVDPPDPIQSPPGTNIPTDEGGNIPDIGIGTFFPPPTTGIGTTGKVGIITDIIVTVPGIGYTTGDDIIVGDCIITPIVSNIGAIVGIRSIFCPNEFSEVPPAIIDSRTGEGAEVFPILKFVPKGNDIPGIAINQFGVIKVVDCV